FPSKFPSDGLLEGKAQLCVTLPIHMPNKRTALQEVVTKQLNMQDKESDATYKFNVNGILTNCKTAQECDVIKPLGVNAPKYVTLQLNRFADANNKNTTKIVLPENNRITLIVDEQN